MLQVTNKLGVNSIINMNDCAVKLNIYISNLKSKLLYVKVELTESFHTSYRKYIYLTYGYLLLLN